MKTKILFSVLCALMMCLAACDNNGSASIMQQTNDLKFYLRSDDAVLDQYDPRSFLYVMHDNVIHEYLIHDVEIVDINPSTREVDFHFASIEADHFDPYTLLFVDDNGIKHPYENGKIKSGISYIDIDKNTIFREDNRQSYKTYYMVLIKPKNLCIPACNIFK